MKKFLILTAFAVLLWPGAPVFAEIQPTADTENIIIVELQTGEVAAAGNDFVELYNPNDTPVDVTGWRLQYRSATAEAAAPWTTKRTFACAASSPVECRVVLAPHSRLVVASYDIPDVDEQLFTSSGFAATGGQIRLVLPTSQATAPYFEQDLLGYGPAIVSETSPAPAPDAGKSLKRKVSEDGYFIDTHNNAEDFIIGCAPPTPGNQAEPLASEPADCEPVVVPPDLDPEDPPTQPPTEPPLETPPVYLPLELSEILPDPLAPLQDDTDEFVEIYNPNDVEVNIKNYVLKTGSSLQTKVILADKIIGPHEYITVTSGESSLSLSNSGTAVQLLDPNGVVLEEAPNYGKANPGQSWMKDTSGWRWSVTVTPLAANLFTLPLPPVTAPKTSTAKKATATTTKKVAAAKTTTPKAPAQPKEETKTTSPEKTVAKTTPNYWIIVAIVGAAAAYGIYEYRQDIRRFGEAALAKMRRK